MRKRIPLAYLALLTSAALPAPCGHPGQLAPALHQNAMALWDPSLITPNWRSHFVTVPLCLLAASAAWS